MPATVLRADVELMIMLLSEYTEPPIVTLPVPVVAVKEYVDALAPIEIATTPVPPAPLLEVE